ncbi:MAG: tetratricopeptide repeat protein [Bdellovibrionales bacterium]|nr:tetratricopeptide repeat protein [Bdellovibrionales bacterium]
MYLQGRRQKFIRYVFLSFLFVNLAACARTSLREEKISLKTHQQRMSVLQQQLAEEKGLVQALKEENIVLRELAEIDEKEWSRNRRTVLSPSKGKGLRQHVGEDLLYQKLAEFYQAGSLTKVIETSRLLTTKYPNSELIDRALFMQADLMQQSGLHAKALKVLDEILNRYPKSTRTASVLLAKGKSYESLRVLPTAKTFYQKVIQQFPGSRESVRAQRYIDSLSK